MGAATGVVLLAAALASTRVLSPWQAWPLVGVTCAATIVGVILDEDARATVHPSHRRKR